MSSEHEKNYSESGLWDKLAGYAKSAGQEVVEKVLELYYAAQNPETPMWAKSTIYGAIGYFIFPIDAIPDLVPVAGYTDDLGLLVAAVGAVAMYVTPEVKAKAKQKLRDWFGS